MKRALVIALGVVLVALFALGPHLAWRLRDARTLAVVVVDKTVPFRKYREHASIMWLLHALKIKQPTGRFLDPARDYVGFDPVGKTGRDLTPGDLADADALVIADAYGVYEGDYARPGDVAALERTPKIYGGLSLAEAQAVAAFANQGKLVLAEFNTFASPTGDAAREVLERTFGVTWTRWVARYWPKLDDPSEVPRWVGELYERVEGKPFDMDGGGLVFVRDDREILVLRDGRDLGPGVIEQRRTAAGAELGLPERGGFWFWFDVVEPSGAEPLYEHVVDATEDGLARLESRRIPPRFPAVLRRRNVYYFAGDFMDTAIELGDPERAGLLGYRRAVLGCGGGSTADESFFWGFYAPIVARLFEARAR